ncbi:hypothetical protein A2778_05400 [Candidatus Daviesbacteria bacterium RIFCSPHIGHO2_01_FULL_40_24]|uniref:Uncharacterized protein n=1 Tax=Candidatus Daviesbacteria bacterium GW2011_GWC2_40_12 TaxID=1618431 RepID=A0A0G0QQW5_9BACT|nr:MAG: hypothetical protein UT45_C0001G0127 [Candidatus Daviesbacteria bacterium GW2011_GWA2_39_33]KKR42829.1 MAG: hypothetical protein UT77_C0001G0280 [Candidatus Daviesbacteria bacterium GW2011_GWC2_40_12]OGE21593.1 MAG: hypothetical protein A2778_05400 [Candidatus Daviesbacteria bacterium RIFCSPHIGHO2_01_FULL_40_24]OGE29989.1 MAG: hypothetical protein A3C29_01105 [Candidatus Daviesbacteria bacterium RIFCSPHIGHO2_02_FULL_40_16]OGE43576.1 MAG: hypothetical protein A3A53_03010 [Candidatus Davi
MFNKTKKLDKADLEEFREKEKLIKQHLAIAQALEMQKNTWLISKFSKYGLDGNKEWSFSLKTGEITEVKQPKKGGGE